MCWRHPWGKETSWQVGSWVLHQDEMYVNVTSFGWYWFHEVHVVSRSKWYLGQAARPSSMSKRMDSVDFYKSRRPSTDPDHRNPESGIRNPPDLTLGESWLGNGSIPINTIFSGMNIHKSQLFWCELKRGTIGFDTHPLQRNQPSPAPWQAHHPCGNQQGRELMLWRRRPRVVTTMHVLRSLWPTSCHPAFKRFSVWRTQWAVTIPDCNMINMIYMIVIWL